LGVLEEHLVEVAQAEQQQGFGRQFAFNAAPSWGTVVWSARFARSTGKVQSPDPRRKFYLEEKFWREAESFL
jgi:hypothetical protein